MKIVSLIILIALITGQDLYEKLTQEKVTDEYCKDVISNMTSIIEEGYVYLDFLKAPKQPKGYDNYIPKVDLIKELKEINTTNRTFYDFYRDIQNVLEKTRDGHFSIYADKTPNNFLLSSSVFCIPFSFIVLEHFDENNNVNNTSLIIVPINYCKDGYSQEVLDKIDYFYKKNITKINDLDPYEYLEEMGKKGFVIHSPQARYVQLMRNIYSFSPKYFPFKKEDLNVKIEFEGNEVFEISYIFQNIKFSSSEFKEFYLSETDKYLKYNIPVPGILEIEKDFKIKKGLLSQDELKKNYENWDLFAKDNSIKCRILETDNYKYNILYQRSFSPLNFTEYENIMDECFTKFYSNDYKIIIIEDKNGGGYSELCIPFARYLNPKRSNPSTSTFRSTNLMLKTFLANDENLNPETCFAYTDKDNILEGETDKYSDEVYHKKTKLMEEMNIFERKLMDLKRKKYLNTGKTKKPTEILIFTDGYSFSCTSVFIKALQVVGGAITVGYYSRPDLVESKYDASQSNSAVETLLYAEQVQNLKKLGFSTRITFTESFDPNDKNIPKIPMEFLIYPVDEVSNIYINYNDYMLQRFIVQADSIFKKYNDLENGKCNPDNHLLYYETNDCDSIINIEHAHGGYLCGSDGKWDKKQCIAAYCDDGYYLNDERTQCIKDPCEKITLNEITITGEDEMNFVIKPNNTYIFKIESKNENNFYTFNSDLDNLLFIYNDDHILTAINNNTKFKKNDMIYANYYINITEDININIIPIKNDKEDNNNNAIPEDNEGLSTGIILLIIFVIIIVLILIIFIIIIIVRKKRLITNTEALKKTKEMNEISG